MFLYLGPAYARYRKALECTLGFKKEMTEQDRKKVESMIPFPLSLNQKWSGRFVVCATDDIFEHRVRMAYGNLLRRLGGFFGGINARANQAEMKKFFEDLNAALRRIEAFSPLIFFLQPKADLEAEHNQVFSERYAEDVRKIQADIVPELFSLFSSPSAEKKEKATAAWVLNGVFDHIPKEISAEDKKTLLDLLQKSIGYDDYIDQHNRAIADKIQKSFLVNKALVV